MNMEQIKRYDLATLLNYIDDEHFFRQKTRKVYSQYYVSQKDDRKRKSFLAETDVFSDERSIQEIRCALGKMTSSNKEATMNVLIKNKVSRENEDKLVELLHQYATLCLEWNDLYIQIYDSVYYQENPSLHKKIYDLSYNLIWNPKHYDDLEQKLFFRTSNIEFYAKMSSRYPKYRCLNIFNWSCEIINNMLKNVVDLPFSNLEKIKDTNKLDWINLIFHFIKVVYLMNKNIIQKWVDTEWYKTLCVFSDSSLIPMKMNFKWMDLIELFEIQDKLDTASN